MIWLTWRQLRPQAFVAAGLLMALAVALALTGPNLLHYYDTAVRSCASHNDCGPVREHFLALARWRHILNFVVIGVPILIGMFWGAPLVARELEVGTFKLAWTQSVTRVRWLTVKLVVVGLAAMVTSGLVSLAVTWWASPFDRFENQPFGTFDSRGIVAVGYAAFAFALGVAFGTIIRRSLPAMAATFASFVVLRLAFIEWVRLHLLAPLRGVTPLLAPVPGNVQIGGGIPLSADVVSELTVNARGQVIGHYGGFGPNGDFGFDQDSHGATTLIGIGRCPNRFPGITPGVKNGSPNSQASASIARAAQACVNSFHLKSIFTYLPASRYWTLQWAEAGIFGLASLGLVAFTFWWLLRRLS